MSKKLSWSLLVLFFTFDNFFSFYAITKLGGREANLVIAPIVEKYPLTYFLAIPITVVIMFFVIKFFTRLAIKIFKRQKGEADMIEKIILTSVVVYWFIGNSSLNLAFLLGYKQSIGVWYLMSAVGIVSALIFSLVNFRKSTR